MPSVVLDASALLALVLDEAGADYVADFAGDALISTINLQEVIKTLLDRGHTAGSARSMIDDIGVEPSPHRTEDAWAAAALSRHTKHKGCGIGDRSCMALAIAEGLPAVTADRVWADLTIPGLTVWLAR